MNPTSFLLSEICRLHPGRRVGVVVSIGCGGPPSKSPGKEDNLLRLVLSAMEGIYEATRRGAVIAAPQILLDINGPATSAPQHLYFRFNVGESLAQVGLFDVEESQKVKQLSEAYCQANDKDIAKCAESGAVFQP